METTTNYKLPQWVKADQIKMDDFNGAFASIVAALKAEGDARSEADGTAAERITALAQTIANGKICRIKYGSYAGNGLSGAENPNKIDCGFYPLLVMVSEQNDTQHWALRGVSGFYCSDNRGSVAIWDNSSVSWFCQGEDQYFSPPAIQFNEQGKTYYYVVLGCDAD